MNFNYLYRIVPRVNPSGPVISLIFSVFDVTENGTTIQQWVRDWCGWYDGSDGLYYTLNIDRKRLYTWCETLHFTALSAVFVSHTTWKLDITWWVVWPLYMRVRHAFPLILFVSCWGIIGAVRASYNNHINKLWSRTQPLQHDIFQYCENNIVGKNLYLMHMLVCSTLWLDAARWAGSFGVSMTFSFDLTQKWSLLQSIVRISASRPTRVKT